MPPNTVDVTDINLYKGIDHNFVTVLVVAAVWAVFIILLQWARWRDKKDEAKVGTSTVARVSVQFRTTHSMATGIMRYHN